MALAADALLIARREIAAARGLSLASLAFADVQRVAAQLVDDAEAGTLSHDDSLLLADIAIAILEDIAR